MSVMETAVSFRNPAGQTLRGILHRPEAIAENAPGVLWLSAGQKVRQGAWRMNVVIARRLAARGVPVLRFDYHGIGDSDGPDHHGDFVMDLYGFIQTGGFREDVAAAARLLRAEVGDRPLVLGGLCGGAISALFAVPLIEDIAGLFLADLPVTISSAARQRFLEEHPEELIRARPAEAETVMALYLRRLRDPEAWRRLFSGETNYKLLVETLKMRARARIDTVLPRLGDGPRHRVEALIRPWLPPVIAEDDAPVDGEADARAKAAGEEKNTLVAELFHRARDRGIRMRFVNSSSYHPTFQGFFGAHELSDDARALRDRGVDLTVIPDTNHIFSIDSAKRALFEGVDGLVDEAIASARRAHPRAA